MKICDRIYTDTSLYTLKVINGIQCCPLCEKPAYCHGKSIEERALYWALSDDTGVSSKTICSLLSGTPLPKWHHPPADASDRGRCIRLLELIPEWIEKLRMLTMLDASPEVDNVITIGGSGEPDTWQKQIPLILREGSLL